MSYTENTAANVPVRSCEGKAQHRKILLVEDDPFLLEALSVAFFHQGQEIVACSTFESGKRELSAQAFDVLLTDVRLGAFNGLQLAVLAKDLRPTIQVIVFSGFDDAVLRKDAERIGATFLLKPVIVSELLELMRGPVS